MNDPLVLQIARNLTDRNETVSTAESCTGGYIGHLLTGVSGSSAFYVGGVIAYANAVKTALLDVPADVLAREGAVSEAVARGMALGVQKKMQTTYAISVTGIAGPTGGTPEKPVGLVYIGLADTSHCIVQRFVFEGDRDAVKTAVSDTALRWLAMQVGGDADA
jgi:PncC family amidohydrolase